MNRKLKYYAVRTADHQWYIDDSGDYIDRVERAARFLSKEQAERFLTTLDEPWLHETFELEVTYEWQ